MGTAPAAAMLVAIGLQESRFLRRCQREGGPARSFWQFELAGVRGVLAHKASQRAIEEAIRVLRYPRDASATLLTAIEHNDVLAACFARCLLWTSPIALPTRDGPAGGWELYLSTWRPGAPRRDTWDELYFEAWARTADGLT